MPGISPILLDSDGRLINGEAKDYYVSKSLGQARQGLSGAIMIVTSQRTSNFSKGSILLVTGVAEIPPVTTG